MPSGSLARDPGAGFIAWGGADNTGTLTGTGAGAGAGATATVGSSGSGCSDCSGCSGRSGCCSSSVSRGCAAGFDAFFFQAEDGIRDYKVTGVQTCALPI